MKLLDGAMSGLQQNTRTYVVATARESIRPPPNLALRVVVLRESNRP
jgi:hypothetical protein